MILKTLKRIVQDVTSQSALEDALKVLVSRVHDALTPEAVSVFLIDSKKNEYVLVATEGLPSELVLNVHVPLDKGLLGLIGRREEPLNLEDAYLHPDFFKHPQFDEAQFKAFLGVPIIQHRKLYGVIIVHQTESRHFDDADEAFLITLATQLGGLIANAVLSGELEELFAVKQTETPQELHAVLDGQSSVPGIGIGTSVVVYPLAELESVPRQLTDEIDEEIVLFNEALASAREDIKRLKKRLNTSVGKEEKALFDVYLRILDDASLGYEVIQEIKQEHLTAQSALAQVIKKHTQQFSLMEDEYLRERGSDFTDLGARVLAQLQLTQQEEKIYPEKTILVGEVVSAADLAEVPEGCLAGVVSVQGSSNSHVAILARALGVPTVMGVKGLKFDQADGRAMIVDGFSGQVFVSPPKRVFKAFKKLAEEEAELNQSLESLRDKPAETLDNYRVTLQVNTGLAMDAGLSMSVGAEGVGLYRSEVPFMSRDRFPSEDEQYVIYRQTLKAFAPHPVTMRTLDIGGDKTLPYFPVEEENPYLGWRGIRITLDHPDLFLLQIRAMLRASIGLDNLKILLPMITHISEVDDSKDLIDQAYQELQEEGLVINKPLLGVMIEVPAAVYMAKELARKVDFISVGTNDLTQYLLAVDRNNARVAGLFDSLHPAMLRTLMAVVEGARGAGAAISVCGEMASDPLAVILLIAMGFDTLSMNATSLPRVKWIIRHFTIAKARKILADVMHYEHPKDVRAHVLDVLQQEGLGDLVRAGKRG